MYNHGVWIGFQIAPENTSIDLIKDCASDIVALFLVSFRTAGDLDIHVFFCKFWSTVSKCSSSKNDYPKGLILPVAPDKDANAAFCNRLYANKN